MSDPRFLQIHTLHSYAAALLNRDDTGQAKRLTYGGASRTRISSQCLKRHWRTAESDPHALQKVDGFVGSYRSRELVTERVIDPLRGPFDEEVVKALEPAFQALVYGPKGSEGKDKRQTLLLGEPELTWLADKAKEIAEEAAGDSKAAAKLVEKWAKGKNFKAMSENASLPGGLAAAMFGRMVTSDPAANIDAPVHVAHAFTVHADETEGDYFTAVDDLKKDEDDGGADTIQETELTSGLFYGYVVIDLPALISNCGGGDDGRELAGGIVHNLIHLIAEVSPGAKLGSTAPYGRAELMLLEAGDRQPRSLASAFRTPIQNNLEQAVEVLQKQLQKFDGIYKTGEEREHFCLSEPLQGIGHKSLAELAEWAQAKAESATDA